MTGSLSSILYSTFDGDLELLKRIIENPLLDNYVRGAALDDYGKLYSDGTVSKKDCIEYLKKLIYEWLVKEKPHFKWLITIQVRNL